jgi:hypothetical protein
MNSETLEPSSSSAPKPSPAARKETPDLSSEIMRTVDKQPGDKVRCKRVSATTYRCNWLCVEDDAGGDLRVLETWRIRDSKFLRATKVSGKLVIEDLTVQSARSN